MRLFDQEWIQFHHKRLGKYRSQCQVYGAIRIGYRFLGFCSIWFLDHHILDNWWIPFLCWTHRQMSVWTKLQLRLDNLQHWRLIALDPQFWQFPFVIWCMCDRQCLGCIWFSFYSILCYRSMIRFCVPIGSCPQQLFQSNPLHNIWFCHQRGTYYLNDVILYRRDIHMVLSWCLSDFLGSLSPQYCVILGGLLLTNSWCWSRIIEHL